jgi:putative ABC transport system permease protein
MSRLFNLRRGLRDDLSEEMQVHLEFLVDERVEAGLPEDQARIAAKRRFGNEIRTMEQAHESWQFPRVETFIKDVRYGARATRRSPGFVLILVLTLALGIGANTAIFSVVYSVLLRPLPYPSAERLVWLGESTAKASGISVTWINFQHWRNENTSFEDMAGISWADVTVTGRGEALLTHASLVTHTFFGLTGYKPLMGRVFTEDDDRKGASPTVVISAEFWSSALGGDPGVVGETLALNGKPYEVIGVLRPSVKFFQRPVDVYLPLGRSASGAISRSQHGSMRVVGLLKPGVRLVEARAGLDAIMERLAEADPGPEDDHRVAAAYLIEATAGDLRPTLFMLLGAAGLILVLACANAASLLLVRTTLRAREIAIRTAIGAGSSRIARQLITESLVIAVMGGCVGLILGELCLRALVLVRPADIPRLSEAGLDVQVLTFAVAATAVVGLAAGVAPVFIARKIDLSVELKEGSAGAGAGRRGHFLRAGLVTAEIAITLTLLFGSGLLIRSLTAAQTRYPGFDSGHLLALELQLPPSAYKTDESIRQYYRQLSDDLRAEPGVESVGAVTCPPSAGDCGDYWYSILGRPEPARADVPLCLFNTADTTYFDTMKMRLMAGRGFTDEDRDKGLLVAVINEQLARKWWSVPEGALGQQIKMGGPYMEGPIYQIVGVVGNVSQMGLDTEPMPEVYFAFSQRESSAMVVMIRATGDAASLIPGVRSVVTSLDRRVPIQSLKPFDKWLGTPLEKRRFITLLLTVFAALAIILAAVGIYGLLNYWVNIRQREIAIRMAMGARRSGIVRWVGMVAIKLAAVGIGAGAVGCWVASGWLRALVFGVSVADPKMMIAAGAGVIAVASLAVSVPLWRAVQVDPVRNLRDA